MFRLDLTPARSTRRVRRKLTHEGAVYCLIALCILGSSFIQQVNLLVLVFGLMLGPLLVGATLLRHLLSKLSARRHLPLEVFAESTVDVRVEVLNSHRFLTATGVWVVDALRPPLPGFAPQVAIPEISPGKSGETVYTCVFGRRGIYHFDDLTLLSAFPFGLFSGRRKVESQQELLVYPALGELTPDWRAVAELTRDSVPTKRPSYLSSEQQIHGLREYRDGDNARHIHWRTSARLGQMMVKEFETDESFDAIVVIEARTGADELQDKAMEKGFSFVATMVYELTKTLNAKIGLIIAGTKLAVCHGHASRRLMGEMFRQLALAECSATATITHAAETIVKLYAPGTHLWLVGIRSFDAEVSALAERLQVRRTAMVIHRINMVLGDADRYLYQTNQSYGKQDALAMVSAGVVSATNDQSNRLPS